MSLKNPEKEKALTHENLLLMVDYNLETGVFTRKTNGTNGVKAGDRADRQGHDGYCRVTLKARFYLAHRLAWFYVYKTWPPECIDHINRCKTDNAISNLRLATYRQNAQNRPSYKDTSSKYQGITWHKRDQRWQAAIGHKGRTIYIGYFKDERMAHEAYAVAKQKLHDFSTL
jgi:hypothetical protein